MSGLGEGRVCHTKPSCNSLNTSTWSPIIQFHSDTIYLKLLSDPLRLHPLPMPITSSRFPQEGIGSSHDLLLGFDNSLGWLTELRKTEYLLDYQFIITGYNPEQSEGRDAEGKVYGKGAELL